MLLNTFHGQAPNECEMEPFTGIVQGHNGHNREFKFYEKMKLCYACCLRLHKTLVGSRHHVHFLVKLTRQILTMSGSSHKNVINSNTVNFS